MAKLKKLRSSRQTKIRSLLLGLILLASSVGVVAFTIASNNQTDEYLVAARDLPAGSPVSSADMKIAMVNLGLGAEHYLRKDELPGGSYMLGPIRAGQLVAKSALASAVIDERVPVVVNSAMGLSSGVVAGASVDIWVTPAKQDKVVGEPYVLVLAAEVARLFEDNEMFSEKNSQVELWVPLEAVGPVMAAISNGDSVSLILRPTLSDG
jgi:Flp pilus assembly protein CpaB